MSASDNSDVFQENVSRQQRITACYDATRQRHMLVALDDGTPYFRLISATSIVRTALRRTCDRSRRSTYHVWALFTMTAKRMVKARMALKRVFRTYITKRRERLAALTVAWDAFDAKLSARVSFLQYVSVFVPKGSRSLVLRAHHRAACRAFLIDSGSWNSHIRGQLEDFFTLALETRAVSSRIFRIIRRFIASLVERRRPRFDPTGASLLDLLTRHARMCMIPRLLSRQTTASGNDWDVSRILSSTSLISDDAGRQPMLKESELVALSDVDQYDGEVWRTWFLTRSQREGDIPLDSLEVERLPTADTIASLMAPIASSEQAWSEGASTGTVALADVVRSPLVTAETRQVDTELARISEVFRAAFQQQQQLRRGQRPARRRGSVVQRRRSATLGPADSATGESVLAKLLGLSPTQQAGAGEDRVATLAQQLAKQQAFFRPLSLEGDGWMNEKCWTSTVGVRRIASGEVGRPWREAAIQRERESRARMRQLDLAARTRRVRAAHGVAELQRHHRRGAQETSRIQRAVQREDAGSIVPAVPASARPPPSPLSPFDAALAVELLAAHRAPADDVGNREMRFPAPPTASQIVFPKPRHSRGETTGGYRLIKPFLAAEVVVPTLPCSPRTVRSRARYLRHASGADK